MKKALFVFPAYTPHAKEAFSKYVGILHHDVEFLCSTEKPKILKKDIDLDFSVFDKYDIICPVGAESLKHICKLTGIVKYNGTLVENKYLPILNPNMVIIKPQYEDDVKRAFKILDKVLTNTFEKPNNEKEHKFIETCEEFEPYLEQIENSTHCVVDIETTSLSPRRGKVLGIAFSTRPHQGFYVTRDVILHYIRRLNKAFETVIAIMHNAKFDRNFLLYDLNLRFPKYEDTMLLHYILNEAVGTHGLKQLAMQYTDLGDYEKDLEEYKKNYCRKNKILLADFNYGFLPAEILAPYAYRDADATYQLFNKFRPLVDANPRFKKLYEEMVLPASDVLTLLENNGGPVSREYLEKVKQDYQIDLEECEFEIRLDPAVKQFEQTTGKVFNPNSVYHLREIFFDILKLDPLKKTSTNQWSTDKETLSELDHPLAEAILDLRVKRKLLNTYIKNIEDGIDEDDRLRSNFNIHGTTSGRLSSSGVLNYQNLPRDYKDIKGIFKARPGYVIVQGDLKTAEVYYAAVLSNDKFLQKAFIDKVDFHSYIAKQIFNLPCEIEEVKKKFPDHRQWAKAITFGIMYQAGPSKIAETANVSFNEAKQFISKYFKEARNLKVYIDASNDFIEKNGYIYSFFGRKRRLAESRSPNRAVAQHAIRSGVNFLVQSVASDVNIMGLIDIFRWIEENNYQEAILPFTVVHDSIVSEVREDLVDDYILHGKKLIQTDRGLSIPNCPIEVDFEVGPSWGDLSAYIK